MKKYDVLIEDFEQFLVNGNGRIAKHSMWITDRKVLDSISNYKVPEGYGMKIMKGHTWQGSDIEEVTQIQNIYWQFGLAPRVIDIIQLVDKKMGKRYARIVQIVDEVDITDEQRNDLIKKFIDISIQYGIQVYYGDHNEIAYNKQNWLGGYYVDFGGFYFEHIEYYKDWLLSRINDKTHFGHVIGDGRISYQSTTELEGKRNTNYRIDKMKLSEIDFKNKSVLDIGCNLGMFLHYAKDRGASYCLGLDKPEVIDVAEEYALLQKKWDIDFYGCNLNEYHPKDRFDIVFYLAVSEYFGFPKWLKSITKEVLLYEGHALENDDENNLKKLFMNVEFLGYTEDRSKRILFKCWN